MFDDQSTLPSSANVPKNLPLGEPDDIFGERDNTPLASEESPEPVPSPRQVSPPLSRSAVDQGLLRPKREAPSAVFEEEFDAPLPRREAPLSGRAPERSPERRFPGMEVQEPSSFAEPVFHRKFVWLGVVVLMIGIIGAGAWWIYTSFIQKETAEAPTFESEATNESANGEETIRTPLEESQNNAAAEAQQDNELLFGETVDTDADQLDDTVETTLGTSERNWDTDNDALSDGDEVLIWKTDPNNPDTDGDTYKDGEEVKAGYSPLGAGRLLEVPQEETPEASQ